MEQKFSIKRVLKSFFRSSRKISEAFIIYVVEHTDKANPGNSLCAVVPEIHRVKKALEMVNHYGHLSEAYCKALVKRFEDDFPLDIELSIINLKEPHLIYCLTNAGHTWSPEAKGLMRLKDPVAYEHNATVLPPKEALVHLANLESGSWYDVHDKITQGLFWLYRDKGYITQKGSLWHITDKGRKLADRYRSQLQQG